MNLKPGKTQVDASAPKVNNGIEIKMWKSVLRMLNRKTLENIFLEQTNCKAFVKKIIKIQQ